jgi:hypothetical protein
VKTADAAQPAAASLGVSGDEPVFDEAAVVLSGPLANAKSAQEIAVIATSEVKLRLIFNHEVTVSISVSRFVVQEGFDYDCRARMRVCLFRAERRKSFKRADKLRVAAEFYVGFNTTGQAFSAKRGATSGAVNVRN